MKNNPLFAPLFYKRRNSNKGKIARAKRIFLLLCLLVFAISFVASASVVAPKDAKGYLKCAAAGFSTCMLIPFAAGIKGEGESDAEFKARGDKAETPEAFVKRYLAFLEAEIKAVKKDNPELAEELKSIKAAMNENKKTGDLVALLKSEVERSNLAIEALREKQTKENIKDIEGQLTKWAEQNKSALESIKGKTKADLKPLTLKVNSPMTPANTLNSSAYLPVPEIDTTPNEIVRVRPTFWDYLPKGRTGSASYVWVNKKNPLGAAGFIGPGVAKPGVSFELATETSNAKKIAVSEKVATELLDDIPGFASYIQQELTYQLRAELNSKLMTGTFSSTVPAGIQTLSTTFSLTTIQTQSPGNWDCIVACVAQLRSGNLDGTVTAFLNPIDYANMKLWKAQGQGQLFNMIDAGATIVEDNNIPVGFVQIAILQYYVIKVYQDMTITFGWEDQDFTKNLITTLAEMRIHQYSSENYTGFAIYDTFDNIKAAIAIP